MKWWENFGRHARKKIDYKLRNPSSSGCKISELAYLIKYGIVSLKASTSKLHYLFIVPWLLRSKLIAWKSQNLQTYISTKASDKKKERTLKQDGNDLQGLAMPIN